MLHNLLFFIKLGWLKIAGKTSPLTVIFNVTNRCNLHCKHCYASYYKRSPKDEMTTADIKKVIDGLKVSGCLRINFCGGEPLLRNDIKEVIRYATLKGISVDLTSNGVLVPSRIEEIKDIKCLTISLDGKAGHHDILRGKGSAAKALKAIKAAQKIGIEVRVNMVVHKYNLTDLDYMINLAKKLGFKLHISLAINNIFGDKAAQNIKPEDMEFRKVLKHIIQRKKQGAPIFFSRTAYESVLQWPDFNVEGVMNKPAPLGMPTCPAGKIFGLIDADGRFWACPHLIDKVKAKNVLKVGVVNAWKEAGKHNCTGCYQVYHHDFGHLIDLKLPVLWNYIKAALV